MSSKAKPPTSQKSNAKQPDSQRTPQASEESAPPLHPAESLSRVMRMPVSVLMPSDILTLQRAVGNQAVSRLLNQRTQPQEHTSASPLTIQAKLTVGAAGDKYEQEADSVARQVVSRLQPPSTREASQSKAKPPVAQMKTAAAARQSEGGVHAAHGIEASIRRAQGGGQSLGDDIRKPMEEAFERDLSGVRIHADAPSHELNRSLHARAFTTGQHIFFRRGEYEPGSIGGRELLAHELTHVLQQSGGGHDALPVSRVQREFIQRWEDAESAERVIGAMERATVPELRALLQSFDTGLTGNRVEVVLPGPTSDSVSAQDAVDLRAATQDKLAQRLMEQLASTRAPIAARMNAATTDAARRTEMTALRAADRPLLDEIRRLVGARPNPFRHPTAAVQDAVLAAIQLEAVFRAEADLAAPSGVRAASVAACDMRENDEWCGFFVATNYMRSSLDRDLRAGFFHVDNVEHYFTYHYNFDPHNFGARARVKKWIQADGGWHELRDYHALRNSLRRWIDARAITSRSGLDIRPGDVLLTDEVWVPRRMVRGVWVEAHASPRPEHIVMVHSWEPSTGTLFTIGGNDTGYEVDTSPAHTAPHGESAAELTRRTRLEAATGQPLRPGSRDGHVGVGTQDLAHQPDPALVASHPERVRPRWRVFGIGRPSVVDFEEHVYDSLNDIRPDLRRRRP